MLYMATHAILEKKRVNTAFPGSVATGRMLDDYRYVSIDILIASGRERGYRGGFDRYNPT